MIIFLLIVAITIFCIFASTGKKKLGFFGAILAVLYFPIGVILALAEKRK